MPYVVYGCIKQRYILFKVDRGTKCLSLAIIPTALLIIDYVIYVIFPREIAIYYNSQIVNKFFRLNFNEIFVLLSNTFKLT